jgi:hypothetical protein
MVVACVFALLFVRPSDAQDEIDQLRQHGQLPADISPRHAYSDFTDPVGRFMDLLAAGGLTEAKDLQPDACKAWATMRERSAISGKFWVGSTEIDMNTVCGRH